MSSSVDYAKEELDRIRMKRISFEIKDHSDRMDIIKALADNGYAVKVEERTEYFTTRVYVVVWVNDSEVE